MVTSISTGTNPIIHSDFPDPCIIRVDDTYYMASTTMHFFPGCSILRSYDLVNWEFVSHVYEELDGTDAQNLQGATIYGQGMWAPSFVYHEGVYHLLFSANDTKKTYLFHSRQPEGPWTKTHIEGFFHDASLFFDQGKAYLIYGNHSIYLIELKPDLSAPIEHAIPRLIVQDEPGIRLGFEGAHMLKYMDSYYLFLINWPSGEQGKRNAWCFISNSLEGPYHGSCIVDDDLDYPNQGIAQGAMIDTTEGEWYLYLFQDRGALGRVPILIPMEFVPLKNIDGLKPGVDSSTSHSVLSEVTNSVDLCYPQIKGKQVRQHVSVITKHLEHPYAPLNGDGFLDANGRLQPYWQFNHQPDPDSYRFDSTGEVYEITAKDVSPTLIHARNTLTQRTVGPSCQAFVTLDATSIQEGDYMGLATLQGCYAAISITKEQGEYYLIMMSRSFEGMGTMGQVYDTEAPQIVEKIKLELPQIRVSSYCSFAPGEDWCEFTYEKDGIFHKLGEKHKLFFKLDHFVGCRFALFYYSTQYIGGRARFEDFVFDPSIISHKIHDLVKSNKENNS